MDRILALDVGKRRIGVAASDPLGFTAQGVETLHRTTLREDIRHLADLAATRGATRFLVGLPLHLSGQESRQAQSVREFAAKLTERTGIPVEFWDERFTTVEAERTLREGGASLEQRKRNIDKLAAQILLDSYLEAARWRAAAEADEHPAD